MKTNVIKLKFINQGLAQGREYAYFSDADVEVGETVNIDGKKQGIVTQINVPLAEIEPFKDKAKTIVGKIEDIETIVQKIVDEHGEDEVCKYCTFQTDCAGGVKNYGNGPIFPPCADSPAEDWFDIESYENDKEEEK